MQKTNINYLTHTWNPIAMRCTRVSDGCLNCWHLRTADRLHMNPRLPEEERLAIAGKGPFIIREREMSAPLRAKKPAVIGVQFMGDLFHEAVPEGFQHATYLVTASTIHTFLILTKRPQIMLKLLKNMPSYPRIWNGLTVCNQEEADEKIPVFLQVPGKRFLSIEPMLGPISLRLIVPSRDLYDKKLAASGVDEYDGLREIGAVILGGETGPGARPMHPDWVRSVRDQCAVAGVPFFLKHLGKKEGRILNNRTHDDLPWVE